MFSYALKFIVAGSIVTLASFLAKQGQSLMTALLVAAPIPLTVNFLMLANQESRDVFVDILKDTAIIIPALLMYPAMVYFLAKHTSFNLNVAILISFLCWMVIAAVVILKFIK